LHQVDARAIYIAPH